MEIIKSELKGTAWSIDQYFELNGVEDLKKLTFLTQNRITIISKEGDVLFDSASNTTEKHSDRIEVKQAIKEKEGFSVRYSETVNDELIYFSLLNDELIIRTSTSYSKVGTALRKQLYVKVISYIFLNIFIFIAYKRVLRKYYFDKLTNMRTIIESGKQAKNMYLEEERDLEEFWYVIKDWQNQNLANIEKLKREKSKLDKLISLIDVGVLVCNSKKTIVSSNWQFRYNFYNDINSEKYNEKIKDLEIIDFINYLYEEKVLMTREIYIHDTKKYFIVKGRYLRKEDLYILSVKDITQSKEHQKIEKKFISNVSHELKTPLTNIKGYLIAVEDETDEVMRKNFLEIAQRNIEKIENIIKDFLSLQKMEAFSMVNRYPVNMEELLDEVEAEMENIIRDRDAVVHREIEVIDENKYVNADKEKIKILFKNLIENAIIYNDKEKPEIKIKVEEKKKYLKFSVSDNGIGIPESEVKNIFNRFYRVDKARTSNKAGTGLGLSIVSEIIEVYSGRIEIESEEGLGTTFNIRVLK